MATESAAVHPAPEAPPGLKKGAIGMVAVIFMAVANAAPITAMTGNTPIAVGYGNGLGTPENPVPADDSRPYAVTSTVDFTVEAILPAQIELAVVTLRSFSENPARTLILLADQYGVPAVKELYDVIPGVIKDRLEGWINDEINKIKIAGKTLPQYAGVVFPGVEQNRGRGFPVGFRAHG